MRILQSEFRVWTDGTVQAVEGGSAYEWMSDDYAIIWINLDSEHPYLLAHARNLVP